MASSQVTAQLKHLRKAADALLEISPAVSAHLMSRLRSISTEKGVSLSVLDQWASCSACGTIRITGQIDTSSNESNRPRIQTNRGENQSEDRDLSEPSQMTYTCSVCGKITAEDIHTRPAKKQAKKRTQPGGVGEFNYSSSAAGASTGGVGDAVTPGQPEPPTTAPRHSQPSGNSSARSRKKARKGSSLSSLLAAQRQTEDAGNGRGLGGVGGEFGLDLMDFMKTG